MIERAMHAVDEATVCNQPLDFNLCERRGTPRLVSAWELYAQPQRFERDRGLCSDGRRRREGDDVSNRTGAGSTAERAVLEMGVRSRMVVPMMRRHLRLVSGGTDFQQEWRTARRHEADRHIGPKQQDDQQQAGE